MYNVTIRLRNEYIECIADAVSECNQSLYVKMENEGARVAAASKVNVLAVNVALEVQSSCSSSRAYALAAVTAWQERQGSIDEPLHRRVHRRGAEPLAEITGDLTAQKSATYSLINGYTGIELDGRESLDRIEARVVRRRLPVQQDAAEAHPARPRPPGDQRQPLGADRRASRAERHRDARVCDDQQERVRVPGRLAPRPARRRQLDMQGSSSRRSYTPKTSRRRRSRRRRWPRRWPR